MAAVTPAAPDRSATPGAMIGFVSPRTGAPLWPEAGGDALVSAVGERGSIVGGIPRFVASDGFAEGFGLPWDLPARTPLGSPTRAHPPEDGLGRCSGLPLPRSAGL